MRKPLEQVIYIALTFYTAHIWLEESGQGNERESEGLGQHQVGSGLQGRRT